MCLHESSVEALIALIALALSAVGGFGGLSVAAGLCLFPERVRQRVVPALVSYAVGALLGVALLHLLPEASDVLGTRKALATMLIGIVTFFILEKLALWRHTQGGIRPSLPTAQLVLIGDSAHNFMDGALIGAAALVSVSLAASTAIAVLAHEIPHELGDFAILLNAGYSRRRALWLNSLSESAGLVGALAAVNTLRHLPKWSPHFLAFASASFVYVAMADLMPEMHRGAIDVAPGWQVVLLTAGVLTVAIF
jgi:zinc and cadmium transporter